jgi:hypothetical protein
MTKTILLLLVSGIVLVGSSVASFLVQTPLPSITKTVMAGQASISVPLNLPPARTRGDTNAGSVIMGSKDDCDIIYDQFLVVAWSSQVISGTEILPAKAYKIKSEGSRQSLEDVGNKRKHATSRLLSILAKKPCGRIVSEDVKIIEQYCEAGKLYVSVAAKLDPYMTQEKVIEIANSLKCP